MYLTVEAATPTPGNQPARTEFVTKDDISRRPQSLELLDLELDTDGPRTGASSPEDAPSRGIRAKLVRDLEAYLARAAAELDQRGEALLRRAAMIEQENERLTAAETRLEERSRRLAELDLADGEVSTRIDQLLRLIAERDSTLGERARELEQSQRDLASARKEAGEQAEHLGGLQQRLDGLQESLDERERTIASLQKELADRERAAESLRRELTEREAAVRTRLETARRSAAEVVELLSRLESNTQLQANHLATLPAMLDEGDALVTRTRDAVRHEAADMSSSPSTTTPHQEDTQIP